MTYKHKHIYGSDTSIAPMNVYFTISINGELYGDYNEFYSIDDKYRMLRSLVSTKHSILEALAHQSTYRKEIT